MNVDGFAGVPTPCLHSAVGIKEHGSGRRVLYDQRAFAWQTVQTQAAV